MVLLAPETIFLIRFTFFFLNQSNVPRKKSPYWQVDDRSAIKYDRVCLVYVQGDSSYSLNPKPRLKNFFEEYIASLAYVGSYKL